MRHAIASFVIASLWLTGGRAVGQLQWSTQHVGHDARASETEFLAEFPFVNGGSTAVHLQPPQASCGCTAPKLDRTTYDPGESGVVRATFRFGGRSGVRHTTVTIRSDDPKQPTATLTIEVRIPDLFRCSEREVAWDNQSREPRKVTLTAEGTEPVLLSVSGTANKNFAAELAMVEAGRVYTLTVTPSQECKLGARGSISLIASRASVAEPRTIEVPVRFGSLLKRGVTVDRTLRRQEPNQEAKVGTTPGSPGSIRRSEPGKKPE